MAACCAWLSCEHFSTLVQESWALHTDQFLDKVPSWDNSQDFEKKHGCRGKARIFQAHTDAIVHIQCFGISRNNALIQGLTY